MKTIRYGVIGCGGRSQSLVKLLSDYPQAVCVGAYDPVPTQQQKVCDKGFATYQELLDAPGLDWVVVASPNCYHHEIAGSHVLEKSVHDLEMRSYGTPRTMTSAPPKAPWSASVWTTLGVRARLSPWARSGASRTVSKQLLN